jgi:hypothetical protein
VHRRPCLESKKGNFDYVLLLRNALVLVVILGVPLDDVFFLPDADEAINLPANVVAFAAPAKEKCLRGDHKRGIRRTADQTAAGCEYGIGIFPWTKTGFYPLTSRRRSCPWRPNMHAAVVEHYRKPLALRETNIPLPVQARFCSRPRLTAYVTPIFMRRMATGR